MSTPGGRATAPTDDCPVEVALASISGRWTTLLLRNLSVGRLTFSELAGSLPELSDKVLTDRLAALVARGLVSREVTRGFPNRSSYALTARGQELVPLLGALYRAGRAIQDLGEGG